MSEGPRAVPMPDVHFTVRVMPRAVQLPDGRLQLTYSAAVVPPGGPAPDVPYSSTNPWAHTTEGPEVEALVAAVRSADSDHRLDAVRALIDKVATRD